MYNIKLLDPVSDKSYSVGQYMVIGIAKPSEGNIPYYSELANSSGFSGFNIYGKYIDSDVSPMACNESDRTVFGKFAVLIEGEGYFGELKTEDYSQGIEPGKVAIFSYIQNCRMICRMEHIEFIRHFLKMVRVNGKKYVILRDWQMDVC